jgi:hypothetical protein
MKILITGSRNASFDMLDMVRKICERHSQEEFIVGDASGVDAQVISYCDDNGIKVSVYGAYNTMRHKTISGNNHPLNMSYPSRDKYMVDEAKPDMCAAIWDGSSHGTIHTATYAHQHDIPTHIYQNGKWSTL